MAETKRVIIDAGHGGADPGAVYMGRLEKDDNLALALTVGQILADHEIDVSFTRVTDVYQSPLAKAEMANRWNADYFVSIHRNAMERPGTASGFQSLIYESGGEAEKLAKNIQAALHALGEPELGIVERPGLIVLRRTEMPAVLVEAGFLDNEADNQFFDASFDEIAQSIAQGIMKTIRDAQEDPGYYQIQVGAFADRAQAERLLGELIGQGLPAFLVYQDGLYKVRVGAYLSLDYAAWTERTLRGAGYETILVQEAAVL
ncbi:MAG: N-acetylmuramoyl-L-alanine amidase [Clostridiales bacterium]|nr:N-acetylmuramoyl-L-alanine amidase [Clostridiales bacterium]